MRFQTLFLNLFIVVKLGGATIVEDTSLEMA